MTEFVSPAPTANETTDASINKTEALSQQLLLEISKALLSGTLATTRGAMQILQGITGALLTSYTTLVVGFGKNVGMNRLSPVLAALPIIFYSLSLIVGFGQIMLYQGKRIIIGDLISGFDAFESIVSIQRKQLIVPLILSFLGLGSLVLIAIRLLA